MSNQLKEDLRINEMDINGELIKQPGLFAFYTEQLVNADRDVKLAKLSLEVLESAIDNKIRQDALATREKLTEAIVEKRIRKSDPWIAKKRECIELQTKAEQIRGIVEAMRQKKDMLITVATNYRAEVQSNLRFNNPETGKQNSGIPLITPQK